MIIVNQNKDEFVNFDNIMCVNITNCEEDGYLISAGFIVGRDDNYRELGYYATEERAKDVLRDLLKCMNNQKFLMKPKIKTNQKTIEAAKVYFENINGIDLIIDDNNFEIIPIYKNNTIIYEMPKE